MLTGTFSAAGLALLQESLWASAARWCASATSSRSSRNSASSACAAQPANRCISPTVCFAGCDQSSLRLYLTRRLALCTGRYAVPTKCPNGDCRGKTFQPDRTSPDTEVCGMAGSALVQHVPLSDAGRLPHRPSTFRRSVSRRSSTTLPASRGWCCVVNRGFRICEGEGNIKPHLSP